MVLAAAIEITGDVPGRDPHEAKQGDHGVGEILAYSATVGDGFVDGGVHAGGAGHVLEELEKTLIKFLDQHEWIISAGHLEIAGKVEQGWAFDCELAGQDHLPVVAGIDHGIKGLPGIGRQKTGDFSHGLLFDNGLGNDDELIMLSGNIEMVHVVSEVIAVGEDAAPWADGKRESKAMLLSIGAGMHPRLHNALADRARIAIAREMPYGVEVHRLSLRSPARIEWNIECSSGT